MKCGQRLDFETGNQYKSEFGPRPERPGTVETGRTAQWDPCARDMGLVHLLSGLVSLDLYYRAEEGMVVSRRTLAE